VSPAGTRTLLCKRARRRTETGPLPCVFVSGYENRDNEDGSAATSSPRLLHKPYERQQLLEAVRKAVDARRQTGQPLTSG